jgi:hypothetical protein
MSTRSSQNGKAHVAERRTIVQTQTVHHLQLAVAAEALAICGTVDLYPRV